MNRKLALALVLPLTAAAVPSYAQIAAPQQSTTAGPAAPGSESGTGEAGINEIVVTAQRRSERLEDVPITVSVQTAEQLDKVGIVDTRGLELVTPGLTMLGQDGFLQPSLRGISTSVVAPGADNPVAIYLDGVYVSSQSASLISLPDVDRIEVDKGPQGTLFGRNATGGAIQIFTKEPSFTPTGSVSLLGGYYDGGAPSLGAYDLGARGFVSGPVIPDVLAASIAFSNDRSNGYARNIAVGLVSPAVDLAYGSNRMAWRDDQLLRTKLLFTPSDNLRVLAIVYYTHRDSDDAEASYIALNASSAIAFPDHITPTEPWTSSFDAPRPELLNDAYGTSVKIDWTNDIGTITSTTAYSRAESQEWDDDDQSYSPDCLRTFACTGTRDNFIDRDLEEELLFSSRKWNDFNFVSGVSAYRSDGYADVGVDEFSLGAQPAAGGVVIAPLVEFYELVVSHAYGVFFEGNYDLTDRLILTAGARESYESKKGTLYFPPAPGTLVANPNWNAFTPRLALRYALDPESNVYATFSRGFKSGVIPLGSPNAIPASPEKLTAYEVGYKTAQPMFNFSGAFFYYDYKDMQVQSNTGVGASITVVNNAASSRIYGLDMDSSVELGRGLSVHGGISWLPYANFISYPAASTVLPVAIGGYPAGTSTVDLSGTRIFKTPKVTLSTGATYERSLGPGIFSFSPNLYYASTVYVDPTHLFHTATLRVGAEAAYQPSGGNFKFSLWVKNLTNNDAFISTAINANGVALVPQPPREIGLTATYSF